MKKSTKFAIAAVAGATAFYLAFGMPKKENQLTFAQLAQQSQGSAPYTTQGNAQATEQPGTQTETAQEEPMLKSLIPLEEKVREIRLHRAQADPDYVNRVNPELFDKCVATFLFIGKAAEITPPDAYKIFCIERTGKTHIISTHRDLYAPEWDRRINFGWYKGKSTPNVLVPALENLTGIPIDYWFFTNTQYLIGDVIDALTDKKGLDIIVTNDCFGYYKGEVKHMSGDEATEYARIRQCDSDNTRMDRQEEVILAIETKVKSDFKENPSLEIQRIYNMYAVLKKYEPLKDVDGDGIIQFGTTDGKKLSINDMTLMTEPFAVDAASSYISGGPLTLPSIGKDITIGGDIPLYLPWPEDGARHWYQSITPEVFRIWQPGEINQLDIKLNNRGQWNSIEEEGRKIDMQFLRDNYYLRVRNTLHDLMMAQ